MSKRMHYVFAYDISNCRRQYQIRKILKAYTIGHQKSLYECWLTSSEYHNLCIAINKIIRNPDKILTFKMPAADYSKMYGTATRLSYQPFLII